MLVRAGHGYWALFRPAAPPRAVHAAGCRAPWCEPPHAIRRSPGITVRVRWSPAGEGESCFPWTGSLGPRVGIRDHCGAQKWASDLQRFRAAYRNRTDDLRITRGPAFGSHGLTCTDDTADRAQSADCTGVWRPLVPRPVPRTVWHRGCTEEAGGLSMQRASEALRPHRSTLGPETPN